MVSFDHQGDFKSSVKNACDVFSCCISALQMICVVDGKYFLWNELFWPIFLFDSISKWSEMVGTPKLSVDFLTTHGIWSCFMWCQCNIWVAIVVWVTCIPRKDFRNPVLTHWGRDKFPPFRRRHFQMHFLEWKCLYFDSNFIEVSSWGSSYNMSVLVQIMAWCRPCDKPLSEPMMAILPTYLCVTLPQWFKTW